MADNSIYTSPLVERNASREMAELFGPARKFGTWRRIWLELARAEKKLGHFGDWPGAGAFNEELVRTLAPLGRVRLVRLWADDLVASYQYCLTFGDRMYWRLPACGPWRSSRPIRNSVNAAGSCQLR